MSEHREWSPQIVWHDESLTALRIEHNATVRAYRDAMAECDRLGKANDEACDRIAELEKWRQETLDENNRLDRELDEARRALKSTIRVPFSDAQIEVMAKGYYEARWDTGKWERLNPNDQASTKSAIRAALAAGGLVPCAVPEYAPEDVAFPINSTIERNMQLEKECERLTDRMALVSAKSNRRRVALKALNRTVASQSDLIQRFLRAGKEPVPPNHIVDANKMVPERAPEGVPSAQDLRAAFMDYADSCSRGENDGKMSPTDFALKYLTPWLREPTGWELDVTVDEVYAAWSKSNNRSHEGRWQTAIDFITSRIRPTFECKECAEKDEIIRVHNKHLEIIQGRLRAARAALEGE